ncbi:MAG: group 1 truncated hemoglobin [Rhodoglobus sp.]
MTIYEQVGGHRLIKSAVSIFYDRVIADEALTHWFDGVDISRLRAHQRAFLSAALDGPQLFVGKDLHDAHAGMAITDEAYTGVIAHLIMTLGDLGVAEPILADVEVRLEALRGQVVQA